MDRALENHPDLRENRLGGGFQAADGRQEGGWAGFVRGAGKPEAGPLLVEMASAESVWGDGHAGLSQIASLCSDALFTKLSSRFQEKETSSFLRMENQSQFQKEGRGTHQMSFDFIRSISHPDKREITKSVFLLFFQRDRL